MALDSARRFLDSKSYFDKLETLKHAKLETLERKLEFAVRATRAVAVFEVVRLVFPEQALFQARHEHHAATGLRARLADLLDVEHGTATLAPHFQKQNVV